MVHISLYPLSLIINSFHYLISVGVNMACILWAHLTRKNQPWFSLNCWETLRSFLCDADQEVVLIQEFKLNYLVGKS